MLPNNGLVPCVLLLLGFSKTVSALYVGVWVVDTQTDIGTDKIIIISKLYLKDQNILKT